MGIQKIGQIGVPVKDLDRALNFYKDKLCLPLLFNTDTMAFFNCDGLRLMLTIAEKEEFNHRSSVIYFQVEEISETYEQLVNRGVNVIDKPHVVAKTKTTETWMTFFKDSEDNVHALMSEVEKDNL